MSQWIDICVNLTDKRFREETDEVVSRAVDAGVSKMIIAGTNLQHSEQALALCQQHPDQLFCTAGFHPHEASEATADNLASLNSLLKEPAVVAVGETGLDFNRDFSPRAQQVAAFEAQLELAINHQKPLLLHERDAWKIQKEMLTSYRDQLSGAVAHCFTGERDALYSWLDLDLYVGITGWICDERRGLELQRLVRDIPDNRLLLETDAPWLTPRDLRPKPKKGRNEPAFLPHIGETVARLREQDTDEVQHHCWHNSHQLFQLD